MRRWSTQEDKILSQLLTDGVTLDALSLALTGRTEDAIIRRACSSNYRVKTSKDSSKCFFYGVKTQNRQSKGIKIKSDSPVADSKFIPDDITPVIVANKTSTSNMRGSNAKDAIILAIDILEDNFLTIEPLIVYQLSEHIIKSSKERI
jgi:hypothetical protein